MSQERSRATFRLAVAQAGVVRREQLRALGWSSRSLTRRIAEGQWETRGRRVLVLAGTDPGLLCDSLVVAHQCHPRGVLTGFAALAARGALEREVGRLVIDPLPWIRLPDHARVAARVLRRAGGPVPQGEVLGVPVATVTAAIADLLRQLPEPDARDLLMVQAQRRGSATVAHLITEQLAEPGAGTRQLRCLLELVTSGAHSDAEERLVQLLVDAGVSGFVVNHPVTCEGRRYRIDVAFPRARVAIEVDGQPFHTDARAFQRDRTRQNDLIAAGWRVLRFTWHDLTQRPEQVLAAIVGMLDR